MSEKIQLTFMNEDEEAQWWYDHREERDAAMLAAIEGGRRVGVRLQNGLRRQRRPFGWILRT